MLLTTLSVLLFQQLVCAAIGDLINTYISSSTILDSLLATPEYILAGARDSKIYQWRYGSITPIRTLTGNGFWVKALASLNDSLFSAPCCSGDYPIREWSLTNGTLLNAYSSAGTGSKALLVSEQNQLLIACSASNVISIWSLGNTTRQRTITISFTTSFSTCALYDSRWMVAGTVEGRVSVVDYMSGLVIRNLTSHEGSSFPEIRSIVFLGDRAYVMSATNTRVSNIATGALLSTINAGRWTILVHADSNSLITGAITSPGSIIMQHNLGNGALIRSWTASATSDIRDMTILGRFLLGADSEGVVSQFILQEDTSPNSGSSGPDTIVPLSLNAGNALSASSTKSSVMTSPGTSIQTQDSAATLSIPVMSGLFAAGVVVILAFTFLLVLKRRSDKLQGKDKLATDRTLTATINSTTNMGATLLATTHELSIPSFLQMRPNDDFAIQTRIAVGGGGSIYICYALNGDLKQRSRDEPLVCKVVSEKPLESLDERMKIAFYQELSLMWRFRDHPNFVKVYAYSDRPLTLMVLKYYAAGDLSRLIYARYKSGSVFQQVTYSKVLLVGLFKAICMAIEQMHEAGFAHCDIKPQNVLIDLTPQGVLLPIISDFGITHVLDPAALQVAAFHVSSIRGASLSYAAPEVLSGFRGRITIDDPFTWKAGDVYALSISLLEMLERRNVWYNK